MIIKAPRCKKKLQTHDLDTTAADTNHSPNRVVYLVWLSYSEENSAMMPFKKISLQPRNEKMTQILRLFAVRLVNSYC